MAFINNHLVIICTPDFAECSDSCFFKQFEPDSGNKTVTIYLNIPIVPDEMLLNKSVDYNDGGTVVKKSYIANIQNIPCNCDSCNGNYDNYIELVVTCVRVAINTESIDKYIHTSTKITRLPCEESESDDEESDDEESDDEESENDGGDDPLCDLCNELYKSFSINIDTHFNCDLCQSTRNICGCGCDPDHDGWGDKGGGFTKLIFSESTGSWEQF
jgi:hypothetical protein